LHWLLENLVIWFIFIQLTFMDIKIVVPLKGFAMDCLVKHLGDQKLCISMIFFRHGKEHGLPQADGKQVGLDS